MAEETVILEVKDKGTQKATKHQKDLKDATSQSNESLEQQGETLVDVAKDTKIFGVSINSLTSAWRSSIAVVRNSVTGLKAFKVALAATGVGLIVVALGSLVAMLTKTQEGLNFTTKILDQASAAFDVIIDRSITFGKGIVKLFTGDFKGAVEEFKATFQDLGEELKTEIQAAGQLADATARLEENQISFIVTNAKLRAELKEQNRIVEDITKSLEERIEAGQNAISIEEQRLNQALALASEELRVLQEKNALGTSTNEDIRREAELEAELYRLREEAAERLTTAQNKLNLLLQKEHKLRQEVGITAVQHGAKVEGVVTQGIEIQTKLNETTETQGTVAAATADQVLSGIRQIGPIGKAGAIAQALLNTYESINKALTLGPIVGPIAAGIIGSMGFANVAKMKAVKTPGGGGGGGSSIPSAPGRPAIPRLTPQPDRSTDIITAIQAIPQSVLVTDDLHQVNGRVQVEQRNARI